MEKSKFLRELFREKWLLILSFVTIYIPSILFRIFERSEYLKYDTNYTAYTDYSIVIFFTLITAFILPTILFKFLNNKEQIDFHHSLPLNRQELFFSKYMKGIVCFSLPYFLSIITTVLMDSFYFPDAQIISLSFVLFIIKFWLLICIAYTVFIIANLLCGMSIYGFLCGIFLTFAPFLWLQQMDVMDSNINGLIPMYSLNDKINFLLFDDYFRENAFLSNTSYFVLIIVLLVLIFLLYIVCVKLYKSRKSESSSLPIAIRKAIIPLKVISVYMLTFVFVESTLNYSNRYSNSNNVFNWFITIILLIALTLVCEVLISQGIRTLKFKNYCVTSSISLALIVLTYISLNFNLYQYTYTKIPYTDVINIEITGLVNDDIEEIEAIEKINNENYLGTSFKYVVSDDDDIEKTMILLDKLVKVDAEDEYNNNFPSINSDNEVRKNFDDSFETLNFIVTTNNRWGYYNIYIDKSDEYSLSLYNELLLLTSDKNYYETASNLFEHASIVTVQDYRFENNDFGDLEITQYYCKDYPYPSAPAELDKGFIAKAQYTFNELSKLDVSEFDKIPLTKISYHLNRVYYNNYFPITTDAVELIDYINIPKQQYVVYDILGSENSEEIITEVLEPHRELSYYQQALVNRGNAANALFSTERATKLLNFSTDELLSGNVEAMVYTRKITREAIEKYDLKLIQAVDSQEWYFGIVEVQND